MKKRRKASHNRKVTYLLFALAAVLLLGSAVGSTRAALTYYSENYIAEFALGQIGVSLLEKSGADAEPLEISRRVYVDNDWSESQGELLQKMVPEGEKLILNKRYKEELSVENSGVIDEYVRVRIYRYWTKKEGDKDKKVTTLSPDLIKLNYTNTDRWVMLDPDVKDKECTELYYKGILPAGQGEGSRAMFADAITIDGQVAADAVITEKKDGNTTVITTTYKYDGVEFHLKVEVDAVQTHNARDAIKSAWGVDADALGIL